MINTIHAPQVYVKHTGNDKGRGVYAGRGYKKGEIVEECPIIVLYKPFEQLDPSLQTIIFNWGSLTKTEPSNALVLGYGAIYNHANPANMLYKGVLENHSIQYIAAKDVKKDEELTVNYNDANGQPYCDKDTWFEFHNIKRLD
ncbi:MAG: SET domain-containing protein-lysine N-methyltransferase [Cyclobacteriaceae bacterium]|nr:SET domain-containing protein-lysine N-methyltransferase [Cyclobacteriaceae bacterium]